MALLLINRWGVTAAFLPVHLEHPEDDDEGRNEERDDTPDVAELVATWEQDKRAELGRDSVMDGVPTALPAIARAAKVLKKAGDLSPTPATEPLQDDEELGAALLELVGRAHAAGLDAEDALRRATDRLIEQVRAEERRT